MSFELESRISGKLVKNSVRIENLSMQNILLSNGFGLKSQKEFFLNSYESLYLVYTKRLKILKGKKIISFDYLIEAYKKIHDDVLFIYKVECAAVEQLRDVSFGEKYLA